MIRGQQSIVSYDLLPTGKRKIKLLTFVLSLAVKGLSYTTLLRLSLLWGVGPGAFEKGKFGVNWGCHEPSHIDFMHTTLIHKLRQQPLGPFDALCFLVGQKNAIEFAGRLGLVTGVAV